MLKLWDNTGYVCKSTTSQFSGNAGNATDKVGDPQAGFSRCGTKYFFFFFFLNRKTFTSDS